MSIIRPLTKEQRRLIFLRTMLNNTSKVNKVTPHSVLSGISSGVAEIAEKAEKDININLAKLFVDYAYGDILDESAQIYGINQRFGATKSTTYVLVFANEGTTYEKEVHNFISENGSTYEMAEDSFVVGERGYGYIKVNSIGEGSQSVALAGEINQISSEPEGHEAVINEFRTYGGFNEESDDIFRQRIKDAANIVAKNTVASLEQFAKAINPEILRIYFEGLNPQGQNVFRVVTQTGTELSTSELEELQEELTPYLSIVDQLRLGDKKPSTIIRNTKFYPVDIEFRVNLNDSVETIEFVRNAQLNLNRFFDLREHKVYNNIIQWTKILEIIRNTRGVEYISANSFFPTENIRVPKGQLPRLRGFRVRDLDGEIIQQYLGDLTPVFYPNVIERSFKNIL